ncbi:MAG: hypothetical protein HQ402_02245 [Parcubacteria group bacterium]|nr:hypothetical protein [Parcubacteria group bacterium]
MSTATFYLLVIVGTIALFLLSDKIIEKILSDDKPENDNDDTSDADDTSAHGESMKTVKLYDSVAIWPNDVAPDENLTGNKVLCITKRGRRLIYVVVHHEPSKRVLVRRAGHPNATPFWRRVIVA